MAVAVRPVPRLTTGMRAISDELSPILVSLSIPSWPLSFFPQHLTEALSSIAQLNWDPAEMAVAVRPVPRLTTGMRAIDPVVLPISVSLSIPSWPYPFSPQHLTEALSSRAQVWYLPPAMALAVRPVPRLIPVSWAISPESSPISVLLSIPSWPLLFSPQHLTEALSSRAQVW